MARLEPGKWSTDALTNLPIILRHGVDLTENARIAEMLQRHGERFLARCFTERERQWCFEGVPAHIRACLFGAATGSDTASAGDLNASEPPHGADSAAANESEAGDAATGPEAQDVDRDLQRAVSDDHDEVPARFQVLSKREQRLARQTIERLAARFAAREAVLKALGTGWRDGIAWTDIEVTRQPSGEPGIRLSGRAAEIAADLGLTQWALSMSHAGAYSMASVVATGTVSPAASGRPD